MAWNPSISYYYRIRHRCSRSEADLPNGPRAQEKIVRRVLEPRDRLWAELRRIVRSPDQSVSVEEQLHSMYSMYSLKSSSGASKSGAMCFTVPRKLPSFRRVDRAPVGIRRATG